MADFIQNLDPKNLVLVEAVLTFVTSPFSAPSYNLPVFLFGVYAQESAESNQPLRLFTGLLGGSVLLDIIWLARNEQNWFIRLLSILVLILKAPTFLAFLTALRQRGEQFSGFGVRGADATVWTMPGGFSSLAGGGRDDYEDLDRGRDIESQARPTPTVQVTAPPPPASPSHQGNAGAPPGGYQTA